MNAAYSEHMGRAICATQRRPFIFFYGAIGLKSSLKVFPLLPSVIKDEYSTKNFLEENLQLHVSLCWCFVLSSE